MSQKAVNVLQKCDCCGNEYPKYDSTYWRKYVTVKYGSTMHTTCRKCEDEQFELEHKKDGLYKCFCCGKWLPPEAFTFAGYDKNGKIKYIYRDGLKKYCKNCKHEKDKVHRQSYDNETKLYKVLQERWLGARDRANKRGLEFDITKDDLLELWNSQKGICTLSGITMTYELDNGRTFTNVSIDRINPNLGYTKDNIQLVCMAVNQMKSDMSLQELYMFCESIINKKK